MEYVLFDVETTGLTTKDEVIQFSCIKVDDTFQKSLYAHDFYSMSTMKISSGASNVHGITQETLLEASKGIFFEENFEKVKQKFGDDITFVYYASGGFDMRMINQTLENANMPAYDFGQKTTVLNKSKGRYNYNLMAPAASLLGGYGGKLKLEEAVRRVQPNGEETCKKLYQAFCNIVGIDSKSQYGKSVYHNSMFDTFCLWFLLSHLGDQLRA